jgi:uncharacterized protein YbaR (Trm112 family)
MNEVACPVCGTALSLSPAKSRKSKRPKQFLMLVCPVDGRHFRGFINDREFVRQVIQRAEQIDNEDMVRKGVKE